MVPSGSPGASDEGGVRLPLRYRPGQAPGAAERPAVRQAEIEGAAFTLPRGVTAGKRKAGQPGCPAFQEQGPLPASAPFVKEQQRDQAEDAAPQDHADLKPAAAREFMPPCETQAMEQGHYQAERQGKGSPAGESVISGEKDSRSSWVNVRRKGKMVSAR